jgi:dTDP-4-dehydrorhamnose 3,5-epimerase
VKVVRTEIAGVVILEPKVFGDERGFFMETWNQRVFADLGLNANFVQDNHSRSPQGVLRGLHYQIEQPQGKLVRVTHGEVFDVAVDLRSDSPDLGKWVGVTLSAENKRMMWIPPGFAHGFLVASEGADFLYKCTDFYAREHERTIRWDDPDLGIAWPLASGQVPVLSGKDAAGVRFRDSELYP